MIGYARLERIEIIVGIMPVVSEKRWRGFCESLKLDSKCEFNAGDIGVTGGIQIQEAANLNPTTQDMIKRFGGSTSVEMQWPAETEGTGDEADRFERLENLIQKTLKRITKGGGGGKGWGKGKKDDRTRQKLKQIPAENKVWVGGLPKGLTWQELEKHFEELSSKPKLTEIMAYGKAQLAYPDSDAAAAAIEAANGSEIKGKTIEVDVWTTK